MTGIKFTLQYVIRTRSEIIAEAEKGPRYHLNYQFLADLSSPLPIEEAVAAFNDVMATTTAKPDYVKGILPLWLNGHLDGNHRMVNAAFRPLLETGIGFSWPWLGTWIRRFKAEGQLPLDWHSFADAAKDLRMSHAAGAVSLLAGTIMRTMYSRHEAKQHLQRTWLRPPHPTLVTECEASQSIHAEKLAEFRLGDPATYPPYFPGDRTYLTLGRKAP